LNAYDPINFEEVLKERVRVKVMDEEIDAIKRNNIWDLVYFLEDKNSIGGKWIFKTKLNVEGEVENHKERLVAQGFNQ